MPRPKKANRKCKNCTTILSIYNQHKICNKCISKLVAKKIKQDGNEVRYK